MATDFGTKELFDPGDHGTVVRQRRLQLGGRQPERQTVKQRRGDQTEEALGWGDRAQKALGAVQTLDRKDGGRVAGSML